MSEHTKEPWKLFASNGVIEIHDETGTEVIKWGGFDGIEYQIALATARRIVACVNALADVPTETLVVLGDNFKAASPFALWENYCTVKARQDELASALEATKASLNAALATVKQQKKTEREGISALQAENASLRAELAAMTAERGELVKRLAKWLPKPREAKFSK